MMKVGIIGIGNMGFPLAENLLSASYEVFCYNRTRSKAAPLAAKGAVICDSAEELASNSDAIITILPNDEALLKTCTSAFYKSWTNGSLHISMSTISPDTAALLAQQHAEHGKTYLAAPIFGRPDAVKNRLANVCISGADEAKELATILLKQGAAARVWDFGTQPNAANIIKLAGNFMIASTIEMMGEAFYLVENAGANSQQFYDMMSQTLFASPIFTNYGKMVVNKNFDAPPGFELKLGLKDVNLVLALAQQAQTPMPLASVVKDRLLSGIAKGRGEKDWVTLAKGILDDSGK